MPWLRFAIFFACFSAVAEAQSKTPCAQLRALTGYEFSIIEALDTPEAGGIPAHCRVRGLIQPEVQFSVDLPANWNGMLLMVGNGGYAGEALDSPGRDRQRARYLGQGFAMAATNTGHDATTEPLGTFAVNPQKLVDYSFRAVHITAVTAKKVIDAYYGKPAQRAYFDGCSTGGRQGLMEAQRFQADFDGILVGAPVLNFVDTMVAYSVFQKAFAAAPIPTSKLKTLATRIYELCDAKDGLKDGVIDDPRRCGFDPVHDLPKCTGADSAECFTPEQMQTLATIYGDIKVGGKTYWPGFPVSAEIEGPTAQGTPRSAWIPWFLSDGPPSISQAFGETFFRYVAFPKKDPSLSLLETDLERDVPRLTAIKRMLNATDPDLSAFKARGGKILMYYGWADPALNAMMGVNYYEDVLKTMGTDTTSFFRFYLVPGMFHCSGGVGTDRFDGLGALRAWVEKGTAPEQIRAARVVDGKEVRTRPLCPYPQTAIYKGSGSIDDAANFTCGVRP
jgi:hypothetical protein